MEVVTRVSFRPARPEDFAYCAKLYFAGREGAMEDPGLVEDLGRRWEVDEVRIITLDGGDVGWLQSAIREASLFIVQLFIDQAFQRRGIGTEVMHRVIKEAAAASRDVTLGVVKANPARQLYARLGFQVTHEDERKFYMRRDQSALELT
jgi:GNAT superfamily N-acetyltransferase